MQLVIPLTSKAGDKGNLQTILTYLTLYKDPAKTVWIKSKMSNVNALD